MTGSEERPRRGWRRALALAGIIAGAYGLAVLVARPRVPDPATNPYTGKRGGSLSKSAGIEMRFRRGEELRAVEPQTVLRAGDGLEIKVTGERPRYVEVRMRDAAAAPVTIFPTGGVAETPLVPPGRKLPVTPALGPGAGKVVVTALFSDHPRPVGVPADRDTQAITAVVDKE
ncbi:MAG TPA: hypothetical protein VHO06_15940 [Polyangia bacterium]|nr:hypothetical protein [Polyangia bacterium]